MGFRPLFRQTTDALCGDHHPSPTRHQSSRNPVPRPGVITTVRGMQVAVLGPVLVSRENVTIDLCAPKQRALLAASALQAGRPVGRTG